MKAWGRNADWLKWVAAGFALVATASAEYELARAIGMNQWIAAAVPGALDAYAVRALRSHREVLTAVLAMVGVNASSHLVTAGVLTVDWRLITAVSAIAPLVLWRVHALSTPGEARVRAIWNVPEGEHTSTPPVPEHAPVSTETDTCPYCDTSGVLMSEHIGTCSRWAHVTPCLCSHGEGLCVCVGLCPSPCDGPGTAQEEVRAQTDAWGDDWNEHAAEAVTVASTDTSTPVLTSWIQPDPPFPYQWDEHTTSTPVLRLVPEPPRTLTVLTPSTPSTPSTPDDMERARVLMGTGPVPTVRALKKELGTGTPKAQRIRAQLVIEHADRSTP